jgi:flagellar motor switch protein FliM
MASPASPAETRAYIVERLVGDIGEPNKIIDAARALAERALPTIRQGFADELSAPLVIEVAEVELMRFAQARPEDDQYAMAVASSPSSPDALILLIDPQATAMVVSALFGGDPNLPVAPITRPLSPTEVEVATMTFEVVAKAINGSGERAFEFNLPISTAITGAEMRKHIIRDGPAVRVVFSVVSAQASGRIDLLMPQRVLLKHRSDATQTGAAAGRPAPETAWKERFNAEVMRSSVSVQATMPLARMTLGEIARLHVGQLIEFQDSAQLDVRLSARDKTLFVCEFGKLGQNYTVRIRHPFDAGQDLMDGIVGR